MKVVALNFTSIDDEHKTDTVICCTSLGTLTPTSALPACFH